MGFWKLKIITTDDGVHLPSASPLYASLGFAAVALGGIVSRTRESALWSTVILLAIAAVLIGMHVVGRRRYGPFGRPCVSLRDGVVSVAPPGIPRIEQRCALEDLERIHVYGARGQRFYRFVRRDGSHVEVKPMWAEQVDAAACAFFRRALLHRLVVEEPQTAFAAARGDGPAEP